MKKRSRIESLQHEGFEINREIVFSTAHLSEACAKAMGTASRDEQDSSISGLCIYRHDEYGFRIFVPDNERFETDFPELNHIMRFAQDHKIEWILFDCDGPKYGQFPAFDW